MKKILASLLFFLSFSPLAACQKCLEVLRFERTKIVSYIQKMHQRPLAPEEHFDYYYMCGQYSGINRAIQKVKRYHKHKVHKKRHKKASKH